MWDGQLGRVKAAKPSIELNSAGECPIRSAPYLADSCAQEFENHEIDKLVAMDLIKQAQTD